MEATVERFVRLARSSPWRWSTLRFSVSHRGWAEGPPDHSVRAWIRRPDAVRVEDPERRLLRAERQERSEPVLLARDGRGAPAPIPDAPELDADGLVADRPWPDLGAHDAPMHDTYRWVAMLDPAELAGGVAVEDLKEVDHHGRATWEALLRPHAGYEPRCSCCPLLFSAASQAAEAELGGATVDMTGRSFADAHRVRLEMATGVCVLTEELGGSWAGRGHDLVIEAVDEDMLEDLFAEPRRRWRR